MVPPSRFIDATNLWIGSKDHLSHTGSLTGDVRTKSQKQKGNASANITPDDLHWQDTVLITSPNTQGFWRQNLHVTDFGRMPSDHGRASSNDNANMYSFQTPLLRPVTCLQNLWHSAPTTWQSGAKHEKAVERRKWHLCRTGGGGHSGPMCNATCANRTWDDCQNYFKKMGYRTDRKLGVVGVACDVSGSAHGHQFWNQLWFCPNNICHCAPPRRAVETAVPQILDVQIGTNLTVKEIDFLTKQGLDFCGCPHIAGLSNEGAALQIDVNSYPKRINIANSRTLLRSRNGKTIQPKKYNYWKPLQKD